MPALLESGWTAARVRALPEDGQRYEVLDGALHVTPSPGSRHQAVLEELFELLRPWAKMAQVARVRVSPADIEYSPRRLVQPDLYAIPWRDRPPRDWSESRDLLLAVEIVSPSTAHIDRQRKRVLYQSLAVPEYWVVDPDLRCVERWRPADVRPERMTDVLRWQPVVRGPQLRIDLPTLFHNALGDDVD